NPAGSLSPPSQSGAYATPKKKLSGVRRASKSRFSSSLMDYENVIISRSKGRISVRYRSLGDSGLMVSVLGLGTTGWGAHPEFGDVDPEGARHQVAMALDAGIN